MFRKSESGRMGSGSDPLDRKKNAGANPAFVAVDFAQKNQFRNTGLHKRACVPL
jgi:hypothetical protein